MFSILCEIAGNQLLYINLTQYSVLLTRLYTDVSRKRHVSLQNRYQYFVSDYEMKQWVKKIFFKPAVLILEHTQDFQFTISGATRVKGRKLHLQNHFENLFSKYKRLNVF